MAFSRVGSASMAVSVILLGLLFRIASGVPGPSPIFHELFQPSWAEDHFIHEGEVVKLKLDNYSGAGFASKNKYLYGKVSVQMKLVPGDSAGTVTAFYMSSDGEKHNEFDFEFLGNSSGEPLLVQTNVYVNGEGDREQRMGLWFDPTADFHTYSLHWNLRQVVFMVDETPIRVMKNSEIRGNPFPKGQPMGIYSSIWNADNWATQGGIVKINWGNAPFVVSYKNFNIDACQHPTKGDAGRCGSNVAELSVHQKNQLKWVKKRHMVYDYCSDVQRFQAMPGECKHYRHRN